MKIAEYFDRNNGTGVIATTDSRGNVNGAVYAKPHVFGDDKIGFIMRDRLTHSNLQENGKAIYIFKENGSGYEGVRLYLVKVSEEKNSARIDQLKRRKISAEEDKKLGPKYLVTFQIDRSLPLVGGDEQASPITH